MLQGLLAPVGAVGLALWAIFGGRQKAPTYRLVYGLDKYGGALVSDELAAAIVHDLQDSGELHRWQWDGSILVAQWTPDPKAWARTERKSKPWEEMAKDPDFGPLLQSQTQEG